MDPRPVLYLDLDDTLISWEGGEPHAAPGAREFLAWALPRFEVRWLTTWCPSGEMGDDLLADLAKMLHYSTNEIKHIRGLEWDRDASKLDGIAWLEHIVLGRPFVWLEDDYGFEDHERAFLEANHLIECYQHCNVTEDPASLGRAQAALASWLESLNEVAA